MKKNRTSGIEETNGDEDSETGDSESDESEPEDNEPESASGMDVDKPGISYSRNIIILN
jgi:hypothetical protein